MAMNRSQKALDANSRRAFASGNISAREVNNFNVLRQIQGLPALKDPNSTAFDPNTMDSLTGPATVATPVATTKKASTSTKRVAAPAAQAAVAQDPWYYSGDQIAKKFGINNDYASILKNLQGATDAKYSELTTTANRTKDDSLRTMEGQYNQYLQSMRDDRANSVSSGITKGTAAANQLSAMLQGQQGVSTEQQRLNDAIMDISKQNATENATNRVTADTTYNEIAKYLAQMGATYEGNDINRQSSLLSAQAQTQAASISAGASTRAAQINADSGVKSQDYILNTIYGGDVAKYLADYQYTIGAAQGRAAAAKGN